MYGRLRRVHFIGIGGSGMSGLAEVLLNLGYVVSGSDTKPGETTDRLRRTAVKYHCAVCRSECSQHSQRRTIKRKRLVCNVKGARKTHIHRAGLKAIA